MNKTEAKAALNASTRKELFLAYLVAAVGPKDDIDLQTLLRLQASLLKWPRRKVLHGLHALVDRDWVMAEASAGLSVQQDT